MSKCQLLVLEGVHADAELTLEDGEYLIGSDLGCDIVLLDPGIARQHLILHVHGPRVKMERLSDIAVTVYGTVTEKSIFTVRDGDLIGIGGAVFRLSGFGQAPDEDEEEEEAPQEEAPLFEMASDTAPVAPEAQPEVPPSEPTEEPSAASPPPPPHRRRWGHPVFWILPIFIVVIGGGAFFASQAMQASVAMRLPPEARISAVPPDRDEMVARVREFLSDDGLVIRRDPQAGIVVSGTTHIASVRKEIEEIRKEFKNTIEITDRVTYVSDNKPQNTVRLPQPILDVHVGKVSWFQTADGMRNFEGSVLADGAEVLHIGIDRIIFRRDGKLAVFNLNDEEQTK